MTNTIITLDSKNTKARIILIAAIVAAIIFGWFSVRWQLGNMLAELTPPAQLNARQIADVAAGFAPADPLPRWLAATKEKETFLPENIENSLRMLEDVVRLSPYDFRWWIELGRAYEQSERPDQAEQALRRAVELAPAYTFPHWQFGNFYLRQNRTEEAFAELTKTTEKSIVYRDQVFSLAWEYFDNDPVMVEQLAAKTPDVRASLSVFYAIKDRPADSLRIWNMIPDEEKLRHRELARKTAQILYSKRFYRQSLEFAKQAGVDPYAAAETIANGSFEKPIGISEDTIFGWRIDRSEGKLDILTDSSVKHEGLRSLKLNFKGYSKPNLYNIFQHVAVEPLAKYSVSFWLRTENLRTGGEPLIEIVNGKSDGLIAVSPRFPLGSADWQKITIDFTVPEDCDGIVIRTSRAFCGENCPILGTVWYDDFRISKQMS